MTIDRVPYLEYLSMEVPSNFAFILRAPMLSYVSNIYFLTFDATVWVFSILLVILCTTVIALTFRIRSSTGEAPGQKTASDYILFAVESTCQMSTEILTKVISARISMVINKHFVRISCFQPQYFNLFYYLQLVLFIALLFMYTSYTANIVALLQSTTKSIRTIADLQNPAIGIGVHDTPYNRYYFANENEPTRKLLYESKILSSDGPDAFMNLTYGISRMRDGMFAFHTETSPGYNEVAKTFLENEKCGIVEIKFFSFADTWCVIQKHSPYKEILKIR